MVILTLLILTIHEQDISFYLCHHQFVSSVSYSFLSTSLLLPWLVFFFFFFGCICSMWKFLGQGLNPCHSCSPSYSSVNSGSLTSCSTRELLSFVRFFSIGIFFLLMQLKMQIVSLIYLSDSLLMHRNATDFYVWILYPAILLNSFILLVFLDLEFSIYSIMSSAGSDRFASF